MASGNQHTCALVERLVLGGSYSLRYVACWGSNSHGQLGNGSNPSTVPSRNYAVVVSGATERAIAVAAGGNHTCFLDNIGAVYCWGDNTYGQLGDGTYVQRTTPVAVAGIAQGAVGITAGDGHTCALMSDSTVRCWGRNRYGTKGGSLGNGSPAPDSPSPQTVRSADATNPTLNGVTMVVAGGQHTCAIVANGRVRCWGVNYVGQVNGVAASGDHYYAVTVQSGGSDVIAMSLTAGGVHTCVVQANGGVRCWGDNGYYELGNASDPGMFNRVKLTIGGSTSDLVNAVAVYGGHYTNCALLADSTVACWGLNTSRQTGFAGSTSQSTASLVLDVSGTANTTFTGASAVSTGTTMSCALRGDGQPFCWGGFSNGALGDATTSTMDRAVPNPVVFSL